MPAHLLANTLDLSTVGLTINSWADVTAALAVVGGVCAALGVLVSAAYTRRKGGIEQRSADDNAQDRLIKLIEQEAEKRVQIVRLEFEAEIAKMRIAHARELAKVRVDFERQLAELRLEQNRIVKLSDIEHPEHHHGGTTG